MGSSIFKAKLQETIQISQMSFFYGCLCVKLIVWYFVDLEIKAYDFVILGLQTFISCFLVKEKIPEDKCSNVSYDRLEINRYYRTL